jgi:transcriptional regulator with PAS, ATPase and Fis domain
MHIHIALLGHKDLISAIQDKLPEVEKEVRVTTHIGFSDESIPVALKLQQAGVDIIITGQRNLKLLEKMLDIPVITLRVTYEDLLIAIKKGLPFGRKMALVTATPLRDLGLDNLELVEELTKTTLKHVEYYDGSDLEQKVLNLKKTGVTAVIGTTPTCLLAQTHGMKGINIFNNIEGGIKDAILRSIEIAKAKYHEEEKTKKFRTILDSAYEGIITTDHQGLIKYCNSSGIKTLKIEQKNILGTPLSQLFPGTGVEKSGEPEYGVIEHIGGATVAVNYVPVKIKKQLTGVVTTFQDVTRIQELENIIRLKTHAKGMKATFTFNQIIGDSKAIREALATAKKYAGSDFTILIEGETGCGKEIFAQSIHNHSRRRTGPFVAINCSALTENLLESELFGYDEGAFTGARRLGKKGLFEVAHNGTIFLDEISSVSPGFQLKLLRALQEREIMRVGSDKVIPINVRIIAATNKNLALAVSKGEFRPDFYFRLNVLTLKIPPLRQRCEDIPVLFRHIMKSIDPQIQQQLEPFLTSIVSPLLAYDFPGNVRELISIAQRFFVMLDRTKLDDPSYLRGFIRECIGETLILSPSSEKIIVEVKESFRATLEGAERKIISKVLKEEDNDIARTARRIGLSRTTLYRKISGLGIKG